MRKPSKELRDPQTLQEFFEQGYFPVCTIPSSIWDGLMPSEQSEMLAECLIPIFNGKGNSEAPRWLDCGNRTIFFIKRWF